MHRRSARTLVGTVIGLAAAIVLVAPAATAEPSSSSYDVVGSAHIEQSDTVIAVRRTTFTATFASSGRFRGSLPVRPARAHFSLFGQPAVATVRFEEVGAVTGSEFPTASGLALTGTGRYVMRLSRFSLNAQPIDLGRDCRTIAATTLTASTRPGGSWDRAAGGTIAGTFTIGGFKTCRGYEQAIDSTISGAGNDIVLTLSPLPALG